MTKEQEYMQMIEDILNDGELEISKMLVVNNALSPDAINLITKEAERLRLVIREWRELFEELKEDE